MRIHLRHKGIELAANVNVMPGPDEEFGPETTIEHLEDGITGENVEVTKDITQAFRREYITRIKKLGLEEEERQREERHK